MGQPQPCVLSTVSPMSLERQSPLCPRFADTQDEQEEQEEQEEEARKTGSSNHDAEALTIPAPARNIPGRWSRRQWLNLRQKPVDPLSGRGRQRQRQGRPKIVEKSSPQSATTDRTQYIYWHFGCVSSYIYRRVDTIACLHRGRELNERRAPPAFFVADVRSSPPCPLFKWLHIAS